MGEYDRLRGLVAQNIGGPKSPTGGASSFLYAKAGAFSWTVPRAGFYRIHVWGAGGQATNTDQFSPGCGGGGGGYADKVVTFRKGDVLTGSVGQSQAGSVGTSGGASVVNLPSGAQVGATGGTGGASGGAGGVGFGGDQNLVGGAGGIAGVDGTAGGGTNGGLGGAQFGGALGGGGGAPGAYGLQGGAGQGGSGGGGLNSTLVSYTSNPGGGAGATGSGSLSLPGQGMVLINFIGQGAVV